MLPITDQCKLALLGQAVGDSYGAPFEFHKDAPTLAGISMADCRYLDGHDDCGVKISRCRLPGLYTDDTQQALVLLHARARGVSISDAPSYVREVFRVMAYTKPEMNTLHPVKNSFGVHRGTGANFRHAVSSGEAPDTAGLGAAMRVGPVATMFDDPQEMVDWIYAVSTVTTSNPVALACAVRFAAVVWAKGSGKTDDLRGIRWPAEVPGEVWKATSTAFRLKNEETLLDFARSTGWANKEMKCAANGFALTGTAWAIHHAFKANCFQNAMMNVCASGGDTDTVAAMTGCLAALRFGIDDIPYWMIEGLVGAKGILEPETWTPSAEKTLTEADAMYRVRFFEPPAVEESRDFLADAHETMTAELEPVLFYGQHNPNGWFSNFFSAAFTLDGEEWPDVEHFFMAQKNPHDPVYQAHVRAARTPGEAKRLGRQVELRPNWDNIKYGIMLRAVRAKFRQNPHLCEKLLATGDRPIHENCKDPWWGGGPNFKGGRDWLGKILMQVRSELLASSEG